MSVAETDQNPDCFDKRADRHCPIAVSIDDPTRLRRKSVGVSVPGRLNARDETEHDSDC